MPIAKTIAIHKRKGIQQCMDYVHNKEKTSVNESQTQESIDIHDALSYTFNETKTALKDKEKEFLVTGVNCSPASAPKEFAAIQALYYEQRGIPEISGMKLANPSEVKKGAAPQYCKKEERVAYHLIQSFESNRIDPRLINHIGVELVRTAFPGYQATISTHMNTAHYHNHIVINAYAMDGKHKYRDTKAALENVREISDRIALQYGLDVILDRSEHGIDWAEWQARQEGRSWKQQIANDINTVSQSVSSWEAFTHAMRSAGYTLRETEKYVTYTMPGSDSRKVRDNTLGKEYMRKELMRSWGELPHDTISQQSQQPELQLSSSASSQPAKIRLNLYVSRYTELGRRRSDLEMLLLRALKILRQIKDYFRNVSQEQLFQNNPIYHPTARKIEEMEDSLRAVQIYGIGTETELEEKLNEIGAALSHAKKEYRLATEAEKGRTTLIDAIESYKATSSVLTHLGLTDASLFPIAYSSRQIRKKTAELFPMSAAQRRELFLAVDANQDYRLKYRFEEINSRAAEEIIAFLNSTSYRIPEALISTSEHLRKHSSYPGDLRQPSNASSLTKIMFTDTPSATDSAVSNAFPFAANHRADSPSEKAKKDALFLSMLSDYPEEESQALLDHRTAMEFLAQSGISLTELEQTLALLQSEETRQSALQQEMKSLSTDYRNLSRLKYAISLAKNPKYLFGSGYQEQSVEVTEQSLDIALDKDIHNTGRELEPTHSQNGHSDPALQDPHPPETHTDKSQPIYRNRDTYFEQDDLNR